MKGFTEIRIREYVSTLRFCWWILFITCSLYFDIFFNLHTWTVPILGPVPAPMPSCLPQYWKGLAVSCGESDSASRGGQRGPLLDCSVRSGAQEIPSLCSLDSLRWEGIVSTYVVHPFSCGSNVGRMQHTKAHFSLFSVSLYQSAALLTRFWTW